jgi:cytochrome c-type biogenesis protein CcmH
MPGMTIGNFPALVVGARISKTGNAIPASGDLQGLVKDVKPGATGLQIEIGEVVP